MNAQELIQDFLNSNHGVQAVQALQQQGIDPVTTEQYLSHALQAGMDHRTIMRKLQASGATTWAATSLQLFRRDCCAETESWVPWKMGPWARSPGV